MITNAKRASNPLKADPTRSATGVYLIRNTTNNKVYVGSAAHSLRYRWNDHRSALRRGKHFNRHLRSAWAKYGAESFEFQVIEYCNPSNCIIREQFWIDQFNSANNTYGYNQRPTAGSQLGFKHSPETKAKIAKLKTGKKYGPETRAKVAAASRGRKASPETRLKASQRMLGKKLFLGKKLKPDHVAKLIAANKSRPITPEYREKLSAAHKGIKLSEETKVKISNSLKGRKASEKTLKKMSEARHKLSPEIKAKIAKATAESNRTRKISPETRAKMSASAKARHARERGLTNG